MVLWLPISIEFPGNRNINVEILWQFLLDDHSFRLWLLAALSAFLAPLSSASAAFEGALLRLLLSFGSPGDLSRRGETKPPMASLAPEFSVHFGTLQTAHVWRSRRSGGPLVFFFFFADSFSTAHEYLPAPTTPLAYDFLLSGALRSSRAAPCISWTRSYPIAAHDLSIDDHPHPCGPNQERREIEERGACWWCLRNRERKGPNSSPRPPLHQFKN